MIVVYFCWWYKSGEEVEVGCNNLISITSPTKSTLPDLGWVGDKSIESITWQSRRANEWSLRFLKVSSSILVLGFENVWAIWIESEVMFKRWTEKVDLEFDKSWWPRRDGNLIENEMRGRGSMEIEVRDEIVEPCEGWVVDWRWLDSWLRLRVMMVTGCANNLITDLRSGLAWVEVDGSDRLKTWLRILFNILFNSWSVSWSYSIWLRSITISFTQNQKQKTKTEVKKERWMGWMGIKILEVLNLVKAFELAYIWSLSNV